jgi:hypothetical protein
MASATKLVKMSAAPEPAARLLTAEDVAGITGLSVETLAQWRSQRRGIPFLKLSRNVIRYQQGDLDAWLHGCIVRVEVDSNRARRRD